MNNILTYIETTLKKKQLIELLEQITVLQKQMEHRAEEINTDIREVRTQMRDLEKLLTEEEFAALQYRATGVYDE